jgi:hypothetical protein
MKRKSLVAFAGILIPFMLGVTVKAQIAFSKPSSQKNMPSYMKSSNDNGPAPVYHNNISMKAIRHFVINFAEVSNEKWYCGANMFVAMFTLNDIDYRVDYDKKGNWIETFRTYDETRLPADIRGSVKSTYYDYIIFQVQEIQQPSHATTYVIHLDGKTKLINLKVCNGIIEEWQKFTKSK